MIEDSAEVRELETKVRDFINHPRLQHSLLRDKAKWDVLCSALDVVGDTELAIAAYTLLGDCDDVGFKYLVLYGILQVLFVQQDAAKHILESLDIPFPNTDPDIEYVREIRNSAVGHPTKRERRPKKKIPQTSHSIARMSLQPSGFLLMTSPEIGPHEMTQVSLPELLCRQRAGITRMLKVVTQRLREREEEHRMKFKDEKLAAIFDKQLGYYFEKICEGCHSTHDRREFAAMHVTILIDMVSKFRSALTERGVLPSYEGLRLEIEEAEYPLAELRKYFASDPKNTLNEKSSNIFAFYLKHQFECLTKAAKEIDEEYETEIR